MNNVFDIKRFGKYFLYDLNNARGSFAVSALTIGLLPLILLVFNVIFGLVFAGEVSELQKSMKVTLLAIVFILAILSAPVKLYGSLTERRAGSDWLMLPASSFEKFLSMAIMLCIVLPVVLFGLFAVCDLLLSWIVPVYGESTVRTIFGGAASVLASMEADNISLLTPSGSVASIFMGWCASVLPFGLGAICFKKGKAARTILCILGVQILFTLLMVPLVKNGNWQNLDSFFENLTAGKAEFWVNFFLNAFYLVVVGGLLAGLFFRIKTLKH